jgi:hypothetical protein
MYVSQIDEDPHIDKDLKSRKNARRGVNTKHKTRDAGQCVNRLTRIAVVPALFTTSVIPTLNSNSSTCKALIRIHGECVRNAIREPSVFNFQHPCIFFVNYFYEGNAQELTHSAISLVITVSSVLYLILELISHNFIHTTHAPWLAAHKDKKTLPTL